MGEWDWEASLRETLREKYAEISHNVTIGKQKVLGFLVGQVMRKTNGTANPKEVNEIIRDEIKKG